MFGRFQSRWVARMPSGVRGLAIGLAALLGAALLPARAVQPGPLVPPKADILSVECQQRPAHAFAYAGAGIRPPDMAPAPSVESGYFLIEWFAHSPGIPPGALVMLETISDRQSLVQNHIHRTTSKSEGNQTTRIEISPEQTRAGGPVREWRVRIVWRGRALAARTSPGWAAARRAGT
ncbi:MAG: hypothetical protein IKQ55_11510 [Kiritimatiellae bacterium]|nr:hypothetical protein [Kiritimatiellia bacterium]